MPPALTPLALDNADLLKALSEPGGYASKTALAAALGRDQSNLTKTLKRLEAEGLCHALTATLTDLGANAVRELEALDGNSSPSGEVSAQPTVGALPDGYASLLWHQIEPDPLNPRKHFDDESVAELADSIAKDGLLENLVVRHATPGHTRGPGGAELRPVHRLVAGERRHRAIKLLIDDRRWPIDTAIACKVVDIDDAAHQRLALVENLQRRDLKPLEEARALQQLVAAGVSTADLAAEIGFTQRWVQQRLQLLELPADKLKALDTGKITIEDARRWLGNRPTLYELTDGQWLMALEVYDHCQGHAPEHGLVQADAETDPDFEFLKLNHFFYGPSPKWDQGFETGLAGISCAWKCDEQLRLKFGDDIADDGRELLLAQLQAGFGLPMPGAKYNTPWLNGPFVVTPERAAEIEAVRAERARQNAERDAAAVLARQRGDRAVAAAGELAALALEAPPAPGEDRYTAALTDLGWSMPFHVAGDGDIVDAAGREFICAGVWNPPAHVLARQQLVAIALNAAAGLATPAQAPSDPDDEQSQDEPEDEAELEDEPA